MIQIPFMVVGKLLAYIRMEFRVKIGYLQTLIDQLLPESIISWLGSFENPVYYIPADINAYLKRKQIEIYMDCINSYIGNGLFTKEQDWAISVFLYYSIQRHFGFIKNIKTEFLNVENGIKNNNWITTDIINFKSLQATKPGFDKYMISERGKANSKVNGKSKRKENIKIGCQDFVELVADDTNQMFEIILDAILSKIQDCFIVTKPQAVVSSFSSANLAKWCKNYTFIKKSSLSPDDIAKNFIPDNEIPVGLQSLNYWDCLNRFLVTDRGKKLIDLRNMFKRLPNFPSGGRSKVWLTRNEQGHGIRLFFTQNNEHTDNSTKSNFLYLI